MTSMPLTGKALRLARLSRGGDGRYLFIPLDHSVADGPIVPASGFAGLVADIVEGGADAVVVHKGRARMIPPTLLTRTGLVVHLSASTNHAPDVDAKVLVGDVEECVRLGADAVSVHVNIGSDTEADQLSDLGTVAAACERWGMPLVAMIYPRGPRVDNPFRPELIANVVAIAADLGVDIVKTVLAAPPERMAEVVDSSPLPIIVAAWRWRVRREPHRLRRVGDGQRLCRSGSRPSRLHQLLPQASGPETGRDRPRPWAR